MSRGPEVIDIGTTNQECHDEERYGPACNRHDSNDSDYTKGVAGMARAKYTTIKEQGTELR